MSLWLGGYKVQCKTGKRPSYFYEIGYRSREEFWGKGYGYEVAKAAIALLK
jgi:RimJ/RimL family protein N-acetyltransferase